MRRSGLRVLAVVLAITVAACGSSQTTPAASAPQAVAQATSMTIGVVGAPGHLDRQIYAGTSSLVNQILNYNVAETLLKLGPDGKLSGLLAEKWDRVDPTKVRFTLRQGVAFSDGSPWNADVAKQNFDRMMTLQGGAWKNEFANVKSVEAIRPYTLDITHNPDPNIPKIFANVARQFSGKQIKEAADSIKSGPIGTGPYKIMSFDPARGLVMQARDDYWGKSVFGTPTIKELTFAFRPEPGTRVAMLRAGEADLIIALSPDDAKQLDPSQVAKGPGFEVYNLRFGLKDPVSSDVRVRQAVSLAIDRRQFVSLFSGFADVPSGLQMWPSWATGWSSRPAITPDIDKARALVQQAGATGKELTMVVSIGNWLYSGESADVAAGMIRKTGLKVNVLKKNHEDWKNITRDLKNPPEIAWGSNGHEAGDASENFVKKFMCGGELSTYCNAEFDTMAKSALAEPDPEKRTVIVQKLADVMDRDVPYVSLVVPNVLYGKSSKLTFNPIPGGLLSVIDMRLTK